VAVDVKQYSSVFFLDFLAQSTYQRLIMHSLDAFALRLSGDFNNLQPVSEPIPLTLKFELEST
jgi:hypothetical protein